MDLHRKMTIEVHSKMTIEVHSKMTSPVTKTAKMSKWFRL